MLIVGAGIAGASAAYEIARSAKVVLLEGESQPGYHTTGRSAALDPPGYGNRVIRILTAATQTLYHGRAGGLADHPVLTPRGALFVARQDQLASVHAMFAEIRPRVSGLERLDAAQVLARVPVLRCDYVAGGLYDPTSMDLNVAVIHLSYIGGSRARGCTLLIDAEVTKIARDGTPPAGRGPRRDVRGGGAGRCRRRLGGQDRGPGWPRPDRPHADVPHRDPVRGLNPGRSSLADRARCRRGILSQAGIRPAARLAGRRDAGAAFRRAARGAGRAIAIDRIERAAAFSVKHVRRNWAGLRTFAIARTPVVGMDESQPGFFWLAGQGGYGIQMAPALARAAAMLLLEGALPDDLSERGLRAEDLLPEPLRRPARPN